LVNNVLLSNFIVDSGAADVSMPSGVVQELLRSGTLHAEDFLGSRAYRMADGSTIAFETFRIRSLAVGNQVVYDVLCNVSKKQGNLLLGQSFLSRFNRVSFDYGHQILILE
jgi:predicted aspartyl protease